MSYYYNAARQRFPLRERSLEPPDCWAEEEPEDEEEYDRSEDEMNGKFNRLHPLGGSEMDEFLKSLRKQLEERFPEAVAIHVFLNYDEIEIKPIYSGERAETSMQKIDGRWCSRRERHNRFNSSKATSDY